MPLSTRDWNRIGLIALLVVVGIIVTLVLAMLAVGMTGAGHGIYGPFLVLGAPAPVFFFVWPVLFGLTRVKSDWAGPAITLSLLVHLASAYLQDGMSRLTDDYKRLSHSSNGPLVHLWLGVYGSMLILLLAIGIWKWGKSIARTSPSTN